jgi:hypothetical protein
MLILLFLPLSLLAREFPFAFIISKRDQEVMMDIALLKVYDDYTRTRLHAINRAEGKLNH